MCSFFKVTTTILLLSNSLHDSVLSLKYLKSEFFFAFHQFLEFMVIQLLLSIEIEEEDENFDEEDNIKNWTSKKSSFKRKR